MLIATHSALVAHPAPGSEPMQTQRLQRLQLNAFPAPELPVSMQMPAPVPSQSLLDAPISAAAQERLLAAQLAHLASQHHASEYSRLKFGMKGSPVAYVPLSLQSPAHFRELQAQQEACAEQKAWWISDRSSISLSEKPQNVVLIPENGEEMRGRPNVEVPEENQTLPAMVSPPSSDIQKEISAAISSQISYFTASSSTHTTKTSQTHPINISLVIPSEILPVVALQLIHAPKPSPILFRLPQNCYLDRVTTVATLSTHRYKPFYHPTSPSFLPSSRPGDNYPCHAHPSLTWSQPGSDELLQSALQGDLTSSFQDTSLPSLETLEKVDGSMPPPHFFIPSQLPLRGFMTASPPHPVPMELPPPNLLPIPTLSNPPSGVIRRVPRHERAVSAPPALHFLKGAQRKSAKELSKGIPRNRSDPEVTSSPASLNVLPSILDTNTVKENELDCSDPNSNTQHEIQLPPSPLGACLSQNTPNTKKVDQRGLMLPPSLPLSGTALQQHKPFSPFSICETPTAVQRLGNLFLSSCPGKKVRLTGPVKGRGAICRDLRTDLIRVKNLGVGCIVCCLNDSELDFLGAPWSEYSEIANSLGLDVLRLPIPEGLAPLNAASVDAHLTQLIAKYTLHDIPILVHCRGGVGRAGIIACCWMLKLGLCGWKNADLCSRTHDAGSSMVPSSFSPFSTMLSRNAFMPSMEASSPLTPNIMGAAVPRVCRATIQLVERAISVVRHRRSLKAVETYEQVRFLVDFVEHLDAKARRGCDVD
ncbi:hypothetical protein EW145_g2895 [Phellinidium pouzarii]|uniref:Tyrosine specific protein phosphatases domain-containing protein n=1 Tax=Phellinidium pouzarii TaxID=167371 RepID=A0A4S4L928_9AGAM|nr:hypothetical protein EW145_g2895 [Phellinidium pouzarii]